MAWTQDDLDRIKRAIAQGVRRVQFKDRLIEYNSISEMLKAREAIEKDLNDQAAQAAGVTRPRGYRARTSRGY
ncbi:phage head-tail joining protein [Methylobacter marinus]|uniref:phage head-tail joining protein n=1 Tax=Methylobacter marinus TaxID=34058 RepID=UPI00037698AD|nr:hypothetical protein [Methylobacter marinus]